MLFTRAEQWADDHGEHIGYCNVHHQKVLDTCDLCEEIEMLEFWTCIECEEVKYGDARVEVGLTCEECAYG